MPTVRLLDQYQRSRLDSLGGSGWLSSPARVLQRRQLEKSLQQLIEAQKAAKAPNPEDPAILAQLLAVVIRHHGVITGYFKRRNAKTLKEEDKWNEFFYLLAAGFVERWMRKREEPAEPPEQRPLYVPEDYLESLTHLLELARSLGQEATQEAKAELAQGDYANELTGISDLVDETRSQIVEILTRHQDFSRSAQDGDIPLDEQELEIEKSALLQLRMKDLQTLASEREIPLISDKDRLAELIARSTKVSREEIAEWALKRGDGASVEEGMVTRLVPLRTAPDIDAARASLGQLVGQYVKVRTARWFVFDGVGGQGENVRLHGRLRSYRTKPVLDTDQFKLNATPYGADVRVRLRADREWAEIDTRTVTDTRDMHFVLARGAGAPSEALIELPIEPLDGEIALWDRLTIWMLGFLELYLPDSNITIHNFAMAHFERSDVGPIAPDLPQIDEVQLRGQHVGSHRDACQLIVDARRLLNVEVAVRFSPNATESYIIPIRIGIAPDHATIMTAAVRDVPTAATAELHRTLVTKVRRALDQALDVGGLDRLVDGITDRARQAEPAEHADILAPELQVATGDDDGGGSSDEVTSEASGTDGPQGKTG